MFHVLFLKLGIYLRQRQAEVRRGSLSLASVDGAPSRAACLRGYHNPSHCMLVDKVRQARGMARLMLSMDGKTEFYFASEARQCC